jgi:hypothetical protein
LLGQDVREQSRSRERPARAAGDSAEFSKCAVSLRLGDGRLPTIVDPKLQLMPIPGPGKIANDIDLPLLIRSSWAVGIFPGA